MRSIRFHGAFSERGLAMAKGQEPKKKNNAEKLSTKEKQKKKKEKKAAKA